MGKSGLKGNIVPIKFFKNLRKMFATVEQMALENFV
jgi:hypothetical protein